MDGDRFVIQGDNNTWLDEDHPSKDQVLGKLWLPRSPGGQGARRSAFPGRARRHGPATAPSVHSSAAPGVGTVEVAPPARRAPPSLPRSAAYARQAALVSGAVALVAASVAASCSRCLPRQTEAATVQVTQQGQFAYTRHRPTGTTYPTARDHRRTDLDELASGLRSPSPTPSAAPASPTCRARMRLDVAIAAATAGAPT